MNNRDRALAALNYEHYDGSTYELCVGDTSQVGDYTTGTSPDGVLDMSGNVFEWVSDWFQWDYYSLSPYYNPTGPSSGDYGYKVMRGGSFIGNWRSVRVMSRMGSLPDGTLPYRGFRCAASGPGQ